LDLEAKKQMIHRTTELSISAQCELLSLNRSVFYYTPVKMSKEEHDVMNRIDEIFTEHPYYGSRRMSQALKAEGIDVGRKGIRHYYRVMGIEAIYPKMNLSRRNKAHQIYPYLLKELQVSFSNQVYCADITYIRLKPGFVYLVAVMDWYSRYILSWRVSISLESEFCIVALNEAISVYGKPDIFNTDQGVQFTCNDFIKTLQEHQIKISMDGKGRALDNVFIERFWRSLKQEKIYRLDIETVREAKDAIRQYVDFYNNERLHQGLEYKTPRVVYFGGLTLKEAA